MRATETNMFNFKNLTPATKSEAPATLKGLFDQLDRRTTHSTLRLVQLSAFEALDAQKDEGDIVLKLSTGSGKTVIGLVYAEMMRRRYPGEPSIFLCPTNQLVDQVVESGKEIGVKVATFKEGTPHEAFAGDAVLACTYDRVFNARSAFENRGIRPSCFVLDDVHAGVDRIRGCYTLTVPDAAKTAITAILQPLCEQTDPAAWSAITNNKQDTPYEVPYWIWANVYKQVFAILDGMQSEDEKDLFFRWGNISRYIELARVCVTASQVEIALPLAAVEENSAFSMAKHRLFMSASIKDGSTFIGDLGCDVNALLRIIDPPEDEGAGERMILPTSLISDNAKKFEVAELCASLAKSTNVVVLTSAGAQGVEWQKAGATYCEGKEVDVAIAGLRMSSPNYYVFSQRFDGVDLPDDACRVLVIDGIPTGDRLCDKVDAARQKDSPEQDVRTVNRFEQALGRAVRSHADYAAVLLVGQDIASFIGKKAVLNLFEGRTRVQVEMGRELAKMAVGQPLPSVLAAAVRALLIRDEEWKVAHRNGVKLATRYVRPAATLTVFEQVMQAQRAAWLAAKGRNFQQAVSLLSGATNIDGLHPIQKAELHNRIAVYMYNFDPAHAALVYRSAFEANSAFPRPEQTVDKKFARATDQAVAVASYFGKFISANAALARLDQIKALLSFGMPADKVEQGLKELGEALGLTSSRPEKETGRGPDVFWLGTDLALCLEAKSEKVAPISKSDAAQLILSLEWCREHVPKEEVTIVPVFVTNTSTVDRAEDISYGPALLTEAAILEIVDQLRGLVNGLAYEGPLFGDPPMVGRGLQSRNLSGKQLLQRLKAFPKS